MQLVKLFVEVKDHLTCSSIKLQLMIVRLLFRSAHEELVGSAYVMTRTNFSI